VFWPLTNFVGPYGMKWSLNALLSSAAVIAARSVLLARSIASASSRTAVYVLKISYVKNRPLASTRFFRSAARLSFGLNQWLQSMMPLAASGNSLRNL
jgi:hypothetical protein